MRAVITITTIVALLTHAVLGCCWHHDHEGTCERHFHGPIVADVHGSAHGHDRCDARHAAGETVPGQSSCAVLGSHDHTPPCSDTPCVFLKPQSRSWSWAPVATTVDVTLPATAEPSVWRSPTLARTADRLPRGSAASRCALLQVWLI